MIGIFFAVALLIIISRQRERLPLMTFKKMKLVSNDICYGPMPEPDTEVEQHLTINAKGQVWLSRFRFGEGNGKWPLINKEYFRIPESDAEEILRLSEAIINNPDGLLAMDVGTWILIATDENGKKIEKTGSLIFQDNEITNSFCKTIRSAIGKQDLFLLDGVQQIGDQ